MKLRLWLLVRLLLQLFDGPLEHIRTLYEAIDSTTRSFRTRGGRLNPVLYRTRYSHGTTSLTLERLQPASTAATDG